MKQLLKKIIKWIDDFLAEEAALYKKAEAKAKAPKKNDDPLWMFTYRGVRKKVYKK